MRHTSQIHTAPICGSLLHVLEPMGNRCSYGKATCADQWFKKRDSTVAARSRTASTTRSISKFWQYLLKPVGSVGVAARSASPGNVGYRNILPAPLK